MRGHAINTAIFNLMRTAWTQPLRYSFVGLQLTGIHLLTVVFFLLTLISFAFFSFIATIFKLPSPSYWDTTTVLIGAIFDDLKMQPWVLVVVGAAVVASVCLTYGTYRLKAWAHWGAMVFIALSMAPPLLLKPLRDVLGVGAWLYCAACLAFIAAMTFAVIRYGPWGVTKAADAG